MKESQNAHSAKENIVPYRHTCLMTAEQHRKFDKFLKGDDLDFYEEYVINLTNKQQEAFFEDNPNFMSTPVTSIRTPMPLRKLISSR